MVGQLIDQHHLMDIGARETIGSSDQRQLKGSDGRMIAEPVQTRTIQLCTTVAIITIDMFLGQVSVRLSRSSGLAGRRYRAARADRCRIVLSRGRDGVRLLCSRYGGPL